MALSPVIPHAQSTDSTDASDSAAIAQLQEFFSSNPRSGRYEGVRGDLRGAFRRAEDNSIPTEPLVTLLQEAAAKRVPAARLLPAVEAELDRLETAGTVLDEAGLGGDGVGRQERVSAFRRLSVYLQAGVTADVMVQVGESGTTLRPFLEAVGTLASISSSTDLSEAQQVELAAALLESELEPGGYGAVGSAYVKGRLRGLSPEAVTEIVVRVLRAGGGIIQIDRELNARGRR